jgi:hypothetical protein
MVDKLKDSRGLLEVELWLDTLEHEAKKIVQFGRELSQSLLKVSDAIKVC